MCLQLVRMFLRFALCAEITLERESALGLSTKVEIRDRTPSPMDMAPAINSASPPYTTTLEDPNADRPAVSANGTVKPSDNPIVASEMRRFVNVLFVLAGASEECVVLGLML